MRCPDARHHFAPIGPVPSRWTPSLRAAGLGESRGMCFPQARTPAGPSAPRPAAGLQEPNRELRWLVQRHRLLIVEGELQTVQVLGQLKLSSVRNHSVCGIDFRSSASSGPEIRQIRSPTGLFGFFEPAPPAVIRHHPSQRSLRPPGCQPRRVGTRSGMPGGGLVRCKPQQSLRHATCRFQRPSALSAARRSTFRYHAPSGLLPCRRTIPTFPSPL
jgi:hypothetical protein